MRQLLHDGRQSVRRLRGALVGEPADFQRLLALSYGRVGRVAHVLARAQAAAAQGRGHLAVLRGAAPAAGAPQSILVPTLLRRVPSLWAPRRAPSPARAGAPALPARHRKDFEGTHVVLLHAVFLPALPARAAAQPRPRRRLYEAALGVTPPVLSLAAASDGQTGPSLLTFRGAVRGVLAPAPPREVAAAPGLEAPGRLSGRVERRVHRPTLAQVAGLARAAARDAAARADGDGSREAVAVPVEPPPLRHKEARTYSSKTSKQR